MKKLLIASLAIVSCAAQASVLFDNIATRDDVTTRLTNDAMPAGHFQNTNAFAIHLTNVGFVADVTTASNLKLTLGDSSGAVVDMVSGSIGAVGLALISANVDWTIGAGEEFYLGSIFETGPVDIAYQHSVGTLQNGILAMNNGNYDNYTDLNFQGDAGAEMTWQLNGDAVPEPATMVFAGVAALAALRRRKRA